MTPREHAQRVAVLRVLSDLLAADYKAARQAAEAAFAAARTNLGVKQLEVALPDGTELGTVAIKAGELAIRWNEDALRAWVAGHAPTELVERITRDGTTNPELLKWARENRPDLVQTVVRDGYRDALKKRVIEGHGVLMDEETGEIAAVAEVTKHDPTGAFAFTANKAAADAVAEAWRAGQIDPGTVLALPAGGGRT